MTQDEFWVLWAANLAMTETGDIAALRRLMTWRCLLFHRSGFRPGCASCQYALTRFKRATLQVLHAAAQ